MHRAKPCKIALHAVCGRENIRMPLSRQPQTECFCPDIRFLPPLFYAYYNAEALEVKPWQMHCKKCIKREEKIEKICRRKAGRRTFATTLGESGQFFKEKLRIQLDRDVSRRLLERSKVFSSEKRFRFQAGDKIKWF